LETVWEVKLLATVNTVIQDSGHDVKRAVSGSFALGTIYVDIFVLWFFSLPLWDRVGGFELQWAQLSKMALPRTTATKAVVLAWAILLKLQNYAQMSYSYHEIFSHFESVQNS
jgi:hypothetical protein